MGRPSATAHYATAGDDVVSWLSRAGGYDLSQLDGVGRKPGLQHNGTPIFARTNARKLNSYRTRAENHVVLSASEVVRLGAFCTPSVGVHDIVALSLKMAFEGYVKKRQAVLAKRFASSSYLVLLSKSCHDADVHAELNLELIARFNATMDELKRTGLPIGPYLAPSVMRMDSITVEIALSVLHRPSAAMGKRIAIEFEARDYVEQMRTRSAWTVFAHLTDEHPLREVTAAIEMARADRQCIPLTHYLDLHRLFEIDSGPELEELAKNLAHRHPNQVAALQMSCVLISGRTINAFRFNDATWTIRSDLTTEALSPAGFVNNLDALCAHLPQLLPNMDLTGHVLPYGLLRSSQIIPVSPRCMVLCPCLLQFIYLIHLPDGGLARSAMPADEVDLRKGDDVLARCILGHEPDGTRDAGSMVWGPFPPDACRMAAKRFTVTPGASSPTIHIETLASPYAGP